MINNPIDILQQHPIRKTKKQKKLFLEDVISYAEKIGYTCQVEKGSMGSKNLVIGNPETAEHLITAHYDTCSVLPFPNVMFPCNFWIFLLTQIGMTLLILSPAILGSVVAVFVTDRPIYSDLVFWILFVLIMLYIMYGVPNRNNANDNSSGVVTLLEIMKSFPERSRDKVCFILFDMEECGMVGSSSYRSIHKETSDKQLVWNFDCVGEGDQLVFFPSKRVKNDQSKLSVLKRCETVLSSKCVSIRTKGFSFYPSDQKNFPYGVGIAALKNSKFGLCVSKIHTRLDVNLDETNVNILRAAIISAITCDGVQ